jgi:HEAT repeat protein
MYSKQFEARHQPDVLVRQLVGDGLMRPHARAYLTHVTALEREPARPALIEALTASDPEGQVAAASVLGVTEADPGFVAVRLARLLGTIGLEPAEGSQRPLATEAARVLASMGPDAAPAVPALMDRIRRPPANVSEESVVVSAIRALEQIGEPARLSVPLLVLQVLEGTNPFVQEVAAGTVDSLDPALARRCTGSASLQEATREAARRRERVVLTPGCADIPPDPPTSRER